MDRSIFLRKTLFILIVYGIYNNLIYILFRPSLYQNWIYLVYLTILYLAGIADTYLRPIEVEQREEGHYLVVILLLFFIGPFLFVLADMEHDWLFATTSTWLAVVGLVIFAIASLIALWSRCHLGKQGTGVLVIVEDHHLITSGLYGYVRHPMYFGLILGMLGFTLVVQSVLVGPLAVILYFIIFNQRANHEEQLLIEAFDEEYEVYREGTAKLIPFIY